MNDYDIFISYSSKDKIAFDYCVRLEENGVKCWIAPRNIFPGVPYARAIMQGLTAASTILVFISHNSLLSDDVLNEIDNAHGLKKNIIPIFIEKVKLTPEFSYYLKRQQWVDAYADTENAVSQILKSLGKHQEHIENTAISQAAQKIGKNETEVSIADNISNWLNSRFDIYLSNVGPSKLAVTKFVKDFFELPLGDAMKIVQDADTGRVLLTTVDFIEEYNLIKEELEKLVASVEYHSSSIRKEYDVYLTDAGLSKLAVLQYLKESLGHSFMDAKAIIDKSSSGRVLIATIDDLKEFYPVQDKMRGLGATVMYKRILPGINSNPLVENNK